MIASPELFSVANACYVMQGTVDLMDEAYGIESYTYLFTEKCMFHDLFYLYLISVRYYEGIRAGRVEIHGKENAGLSGFYSCYQRYFGQLYPLFLFLFFFLICKRFLGLRNIFISRG